MVFLRMKSLGFLIFRVKRRVYLKRYLWIFSKMGTGYNCQKQTRIARNSGVMFLRERRICRLRRCYLCF